MPPSKARRRRGGGGGRQRRKRTIKKTRRVRPTQNEIEKEGEEALGKSRARFQNRTRIKRRVWSLCFSKRKDSLGRRRKAVEERRREDGGGGGDGGGVKAERKGKETLLDDDDDDENDDEKNYTLDLGELHRRVVENGRRNGGMTSSARVGYVSAKGRKGGGRNVNQTANLADLDLADEETVRQLLSSLPVSHYEERKKKTEDLILRVSGMV